MSIISPDAEGRREGARQADGRFGAQEVAENVSGLYALRAPDSAELSADIIDVTLADKRRLTVSVGQDDDGERAYVIDVIDTRGEVESTDFAYSNQEAVVIVGILERAADSNCARRAIPERPDVKLDRDGNTVKSRSYTLTDGTTRLGPDYDNDESHLVGFAHDGSPVMHYDAGKSGFYYGLSACCWATDKGSENGVVCRNCYHDLEGTTNIFDERDIAVRVERAED